MTASRLGPSTMFVGCYARADEPGIHAFEFDAKLRPLGAFTGVANPSWLSIHPGGSHLYATSEVGRGDSGGHGSVHAFAIDDSGPAIDLVPLGHQTSAGDHPCHLAIDPSGRWLSVANYSTGNVAVLPIRPDGSLGEMTAAAQHTGSGPVAGRQAGPHAHATLFTADGRWLISADLGIDRMVVHAFDSASGTLTPHAEIPAAPGAGPRLLAMLDSRLLVIHELDNTLGLYDWRDGDARPVQTLSTVPADAGDSIAAGLALSSTGHRIYVTNRGHDTVSVFEYDAVAGLTHLSTRPCDGNWPRSCVVTPGGRHLVIANRRSDRVSVVELTDDDGDVGPVVDRARLPEPSSVVFSERPSLRSPRGSQPSGSLEK